MGKLWNNDEYMAMMGKENAKNYQTYKKQVEDDYDKNYSIGGNFLNWLGNGLSGGGWTKNDYMSKRGLTSDVDQYGQSGAFADSDMKELMNMGSEYNRARTAQLDAGKGLFSGIPIVGDILSAPAQVVSAGKDLADGGISKWQNGKRDWLSDLGAVGETALTFALPGATKGASLGKTIGRGALTGAGFGLTGGLNDMGAENFDLGQLALGTALGAGIGGGISGLGYGLGKAWNKATTTTAPVSADTTPYQEALNTLKNNAGGAMYSNTPTNLPAVRGLDTARVTLNNLDDDTLKQLFKSSLKNVRGKTGANEATTAVKNSKDLLQEFLKNGVPTTNETVKVKGLKNILKNIKSQASASKSGNKISNLLKTKRGKVMAGAGGGLLLAQLLRNGNADSNNLSEEEMNELYNYVYGGGQ